MISLLCFIIDRFSTTVYNTSTNYLFWCKNMARVICSNCLSKATITSTEKQSDHVVHLYCSCNNTKECGATFRISQSFDHFLNPPVKSTAQMAAALLKTLPRHEQLELLGNHG